MTAVYSEADVLHRADDIDIHTGKLRSLNEKRVTYSHAEKMRASLTHQYGRNLGLATTPWTPDPDNHGSFTGNPALAPILATYMVSLQRRKVTNMRLVFRSVYCPTLPVSRSAREKWSLVLEP